VSKFFTPYVGYSIIVEYYTKNLINEMNLIAKYHEESKQRLFGFVFSTQVVGPAFSSPPYSAYTREHWVELQNSLICPYFWMFKVIMTL